MKKHVWDSENDTQAWISNRISTMRCFSWEMPKKKAQFKVYDYWSEHTDDNVNREDW